MKALALVVLVLGACGTDGNVRVTWRLEIDGTPTSCAGGALFGIATIDLDILDGPRLDDLPCDEGGVDLALDVGAYEVRLDAYEGAPAGDYEGEGLATFVVASDDAPVEVPVTIVLDD
jgi:hypothetical protein